MVKLYSAAKSKLVNEAIVQAYFPAVSKSVCQLQKINQEISEHDLIKWRWAIVFAFHSSLWIYIRSQALDFEAYADEWQHCGTSLPSDLGSNFVLYRASK